MFYFTCNHGRTLGFVRSLREFVAVTVCVYSDPRSALFFFFWYSTVVAGQWLPSLRHITDICLQLVSLLFRIPRICCSSAVVSFCLSYLSLPSRTSHNNTSCRRTCPSHLRFRWFILLMIQRFSLTRFRTSELLTFAVQLIFSIFLHIHISKASILFISILDIVHVSAAYKATLHTRH